MVRAIPCLLGAAAVLALSACSSGDKYPSLAMRPAERTAAAAADAPPPPATMPDAPPSVATPAIASRLAKLVEQARGGHGSFSAKRGGAERLVSAASGAAVASDSWSVANVAIADLDSSRSPVMVALAEIDQIYASESIAAADSGDHGNADAAIAAREQVNGWLAEEDGALSRLRGRLRG